MSLEFASAEIPDPQFTHLLPVPSYITCLISQSVRCVLHKMRIRVALTTQGYYVEGIKRSQEMNIIITVNYVPSHFQVVSVY